MRVVLAQPRGFCAGVERAIEIVERALEKYGPPIYVRHEIVHNRHVVERLHAKGAHFVDEIDEIPKGAVTIFSAHGVASAIDAQYGEPTSTHHAIFDDAASRGCTPFATRCRQRVAAEKACECPSRLQASRRIMLWDDLVPYLLDGET